MADATALTSKRQAPIAIIYDNTVRPDTVGEYCRHALTALGFPVSHYLPTEVNDVPPVYALYLRVDDDLDYALPDALHPLAYWAIDTHRDYARRLERARTAEWVFCAQRDGTLRMRADGLRNAYWLPLACDPTVHRRISGIRKEYDICFVGNRFPGDGDRTRLVEWIRREFPRAFVGQAYGDEMARIYSASRVVFNCAIRNDVNMRVFEAAACGSLLITNDLAENGQDLLFTPGAHLLTYQRAEDLRPLIRQFLHDENERERIAEAGMHHTQARHTYQHRMKDILDVVCHGTALEEKYPVANPDAASGRPEPERRVPSGATWQPDRSDGERREPGALAMSHSPSAPSFGGADPGGRTPEVARPIASIIIPTFNNLPLTQRCVASIRAFTTAAHEVVVVDNASTDGTAAWARREGLRVIANAENLGFPKACNQGMLLAGGEYLVLLNNDTVVSPGWLELLLAHAQADPTTGLVGPSTNFAVPPQKIPADYGSHEQFLAFAARISSEHRGRAVAVDRLVGLCLLIPRRIVQTVGLLDERFGLGNFEDDDYCLRVRMAGYRLLWAQDVFIHHEGHQSFRRLGDGEFQRILDRNRRLFLEKWALAHAVRAQYVDAGPGEATRGSAVPGSGAADRGWDLLRAGRYADAYDDFEANVRQAPGDLRSMLGLGLAAEGRGAPAAAALAYRAVLDVAPDNADACRGLARVNSASAAVPS